MLKKIIICFSLVICITALERELTVRGIDNFYNVCQGIAYDVKQSSDSQNLVVWLVDMVPGIEEEIEQIKGEISYFFDFDIPGLHMSVVTMNKDVEFSLPLTTKADEVIRTFESLQYRKGVNQYKNRLQPLRTIAEKYNSFEGNKYVVYFSLSPWENEDDLELTLNLLKKNNFRFYAVSLEAVFADHYVIVNNIKDKNYDFYGQESVVEESIWGWLTFPGGYYLNGDKKEDILPSGFGFYGLSRLAHELGGYYYIYDPSVKDLEKAISNKNTPTNKSEENILQYSSYRLDSYKPSWCSRSEYQRKVRNSIKEFYFKCWNELSGLKGVVSHTSPYKISLQISLAKNRKQKVDPLVYNFNSYSQIESSLETCQEKFELVNRVIKDIKRQKSRIKDSQNRDGAHLDLLYVNLLKVHLHLQQYLKTILSITQQKNKMKRSLRNNYTIRINTKVLGNFVKGITAKKQKISRAEKKIITKTLEEIDSIAFLHKGTPWEYACRSGNCLVFDFSVVPPAPKKKETKKENKVVQKEKKPEEKVIVPPTRILKSSTDKNTEISDIGK